MDTKIINKDTKIINSLGTKSAPGEYFLCVLTKLAGSPVIRTIPLGKVSNPKMEFVPTEAKALQP